MSETPGSHSIADGLRWVAAFALVVSVLSAASVGVDLFPFWDMDPGRQWIPSTGLSPAKMLVVSVIPMLAAAGAMLSASISGQRVVWGQATLAAIGSAGVIIHGLTHGPAGVEHLVHATPWIGMAGAWVAAAQLSVSPGFRRLLLAVVGGFVVMLVSKGALQVFVEHPITVADFEQNRQAILESRGWTPGSATALSYERRLSQAEATGWFGLSNVYASFAAAGLAGLAAALVAGWRDRRAAKFGLVACGVGAVCAALALALSGSKGGIGAAGVALIVVGGLGLLRRLMPGWAMRASPWIGPAVIVGVLGLVAARGLVGEAIGERSVLFRAFYAVGALRIWGEHPLLGVGPAGFQDAYSSAKPAISPETVMSPHSVTLDWVSTLGVFGVAWVAMLVWSARSLCATAVSALRMSNTTDDGEHGREGQATQAQQTRADLRFILLAVAAVTLIALFVERAIATPEVAGARLIGAAGWIVVSIGVHRLLCRSEVTGWLGAASGLALLAQAQIEVTPVWVNSAMLFGLWVGAAGGTGGGRSFEDPLRPRLRRAHLPRKRGGGREGTPSDPPSAAHLPRKRGGGRDGTPSDPPSAAHLPRKRGGGREVTPSDPPSAAHLPRKRGGGREVTPSDPPSAAHLPRKRGGGRDAPPPTSPSASPPPPQARGREHPLRLVAVAAWVVLPALVLGIGLPRVYRWETRLTEAAEVMRPVAEAHVDLQRLESGDAGVSAEGLTQRVSMMLGRRVPGRPGDLAAGIDLLRATRLSAAAGVLLEAVEARPGHEGTRTAAGKLLLEEAARLAAAYPAKAIGRLGEAVTLAEEGTRVSPGSVGAWDWLGVTCERAAEIAERMAGETARAVGWRGSAWAAWIECDRLSPYSVRPAVRLMDLAPLVERPAGVWAVEALHRDELTGLDPLVGLTDAERARAERISNGD